MVFLTGSGSPQFVANTLITYSVLSQANLINNNLKKHNSITPNESRYGKRWALLKVKITVPNSQSICCKREESIVLKIGWLLQAIIITLTMFDYLVSSTINSEGFISHTTYIYLTYISELLA